MLELPAPAADPPVPEPDAHEPAEAERLAEDIAEADAEAEASPSRLHARGRALGYTTMPSGDPEEQLALDRHEVNAWCEPAA